MASTLENPVPAGSRILDPVFQRGEEKDSFEDVERGSMSQRPLVPSTIDEEEEKDLYLVDFDGLDDPTNPLNWSRTYKWAIVILLSSVNLVALVLLNLTWRLAFQ